MEGALYSALLKGRFVGLRAAEPPEKTSDHPRDLRFCFGCGGFTVPASQTRRVARIRDQAPVRLLIPRLSRGNLVLPDQGPDWSLGIRVYLGCFPEGPVDSPLAGWLPRDSSTTFFPVSPLVSVFSVAPPEGPEVVAEDLASVGLPGVVLFSVEPVADGLAC